MPRNLTDLMEAAVAAAPAETHHAADITHLAQRHQRRRTTLVAGGAALAVIAVAGLTVGLSQSHPTKPEPADGFLHDQTVDVSSAVPASSVPGYQIVPWKIPSIVTYPHSQLVAPAAYHDIDGDGRLIVTDYARDSVGVTVRLFEAPGQPRALQAPPDPGTSGGKAVSWVPSFSQPGQLLWSRSLPTASASQGVYLTGLDGAHPRFVSTDVQLTKTLGTDVSDPWIEGDRMWFTSFDHALPAVQGTAYSLYSSSLAGSARKVADDVLSADVNDGQVAWITKEGVLMTERAAGGSPRRIAVPLPSGCRLPSVPLQQMYQNGYLAVDRSMIALTVTCGRGKDTNEDLLAFDLSGRLLVHVTGATVFAQSLGQDGLVLTGFLPPDGNFVSYRYDLTTGRLAQLGTGVAQQPPLNAKAAGDYVLWYDASGGHVGHFGG